MSSLFRGYNNLILGFNTFLPDGYKIELRDIDGKQNPVAVGPNKLVVVLMPPPSCPSSSCCCCSPLSRSLGSLARGGGRACSLLTIVHPCIRLPCCAGRATNKEVEPDEHLKSKK